MYNTRIFYFILGIFLMVSILVLNGCSPYVNWEKSEESLRSQVSREANPNVAPEVLDELVNGNNSFSLDLYQSVHDREGNLFFSPFSISMALAMTYAGARENTEAQMAQTMQFSLSQEVLHKAFNILDLDLSQIPENESNEEREQFFQLNIANSIWGQRDYDFLTEYIDLLALNYGAGLQLVNFAGSPESTRQTINQWIEDQTAQKIKNLIPEGGIDSLTRLVLANAIYFKADWLHTFDKNNTQDLPFYLLNGENVTVPMMSFSSSKILPYTDGEGYQAVELPYVGGTTSMVVLIPDSGKFEAFESELTSSEVKDILNDMVPNEVELTLPKFSFESEFSLKQNLSKMGMPEAFDAGRADFSGMDGKKELFIGDIFHKAFVAVDEKGTEAAAATAVIMEAMMAPVDNIELRVDRPFIFLIRDQSTGTILFLGRVLDPS